MNLWQQLQHLRVTRFHKFMVIYSHSHSHSFRFHSTGVALLMFACRAITLSQFSSLNTSFYCLCMCFILSFFCCCCCCRRRFLGALVCKHNKSIILNVQFISFISILSSLTFSVLGLFIALNGENTLCAIFLSFNAKLK